MPIYAYFNSRTQAVEERWRPMALRDAVPRYLKRCLAAPSLRPEGMAEKPEIDLQKQALSGFKAIEARPGGAREIERVMEMKPEAIKNVWNRPAATAPLPA